MTDEPVPADQGGDYKVGPGKPPLHSRFKKGQSGNPSGKPKGCFSVAKALQRLMLEESPLTYSPKNGAEMTALALVRRAIDDGSKDAVSAIREIMQRMDGKVPDRIAGEDGGGLTVVFKRAEPPSEDDDDVQPAPEAGSVPRGE